MLHLFLLFHFHAGLCKPVFSTVALDIGTLNHGDDMSGSSSDSQSSIILANGPTKHPQGAGPPPRRAGPNPNPASSIWSPFGQCRDVACHVMT